MSKSFKKHVFIGLLIMVSNVHFAQDTTAVVSHPPKKITALKGLIAPVALMSAGFFLHQTNGYFNKYDIQDNVQKNFAINTKADDYVQYSSFILFAAMKAFGKEGKNSTKNQLLLLGKSQIIMAGTVYFLKKTTNIERPAGGSRRSFPSGHTSMSFASAAFLFKEYHDTHKAIAWGGYVLATTTGLMRVMNNKHWMSDVAFGAGLGILCTELVYLHHNRRRKNKNQYTSLLVLPEVSSRHMGLNLNYKF